MKNYVLHHSSADNYEAYRNAAMRWEEQQRLFSDFETTGHSKKVNSLEGNAEYYSCDEYSSTRLKADAGSVEAESTLQVHATRTLVRSDVFDVGNLDMLVSIVLHALRMEKEKVVRKAREL